MLRLTVVGLVTRIKVNYMKIMLPNQVYAGLFEVLKNQRFYYYSKVGPNYCHLTEEGEKAVLAWVNLMAPEMHRLEEEELDERAKKMMWEELKK